MKFEGAESFGQAFCAKMTSRKRRLDLEGRERKSGADRGDRKERKRRFRKDAPSQEVDTGIPVDGSTYTLLRFFCVGKKYFLFFESILGTVRHIARDGTQSCSNEKICQVMTKRNFSFFSPSLHSRLLKMEFFIDALKLAIKPHFEGKT